ncbi:MAG: VWA domain-containing protein, partial [Desulfovibrio sp.]|nr:VWA domain-containing protein [Desulfovibrio sp.]
DTTADWSVTVPATANDGRASYADLDESQFAAKGIIAVDNGNGTYTLTGTVTIPAGDESAEIRIPTLDDAIVENDENLTLKLNNVVNAAAETLTVLDNGEYTGVITDNDEPLVFTLDEAGLSFGSQTDGHGPASMTGAMSNGALDGDATGLSWDTAHMPELFADGNHDGAYAKVDWRQEGNALKGYADGKVAIEFTPTFENGHFTGEFTATLHSAVKHGAPGSATDESLSLNLPFAQTGPKGNTPGSIDVDIKDDKPDYSGDPTKLTVNEGGSLKEDVFLVLDVSGSITAEQFVDYMNAVRALVQAYADNNVEARFSVVAFAGKASVPTQFQHLTAEEFLRLATTDYAGRNALQPQADAAIGTNYTAAFNALMPQLDASRNSSEYGDWGRKVYFLTDGKENLFEGKFNSTWTPYLAAHDDVSAYGIGIGSDFSNPNSDASKAVGNAVGGSDHVILLEDYNDLSARLIGLIEGASGDLLEGVASADLTTVESVLVSSGSNTVSYRMDHTDADGKYANIPVGNGIYMKIYTDGHYTFTAGNVNEDLHINFQLVMKDADGDRSSHNYELTVLDHNPVAYDNTDYMHPESVANHGVSLNGGTSANSWTSAGWSMANTAVNSNVLPKAIDYPSALVAELQSVYGINITALAQGSNAVLTANRFDVAVEAFERIQEHLGHNNPVTQLLGDLGISTNYVYEYYEDSIQRPRIALASRDITSTGGEVVVGWSFKGDADAKGSDAAFWVLMDDKNNIIAKGALANTGHGSSGSFTDSGVLRIAIPDGSPSTHYKLVLGAVEGCAPSSNNTVATLAVDTVVNLEHAYTFSYRGNMMTDPSPTGESDQAWDQAHVGSVTYNGVTRAFGSDKFVTFTSDEGRLTVWNNGEYIFQGTKPESAWNGGEFTYQLVDRDGDWSNPATVTLYDDTPPPIARLSALFAPEESGSGNEAINGNEGDNVINGSAGDDTISGGAGNDEIHGEAGNDTISGDAGDDTIFGGIGNDIIYGGTGNDTINGDAGEDTILGGAGQDLIYGGAGADLIYGGADDDLIFGGAGNDIIYSGAGNDTMYGGEGSDIFMLGGDDIGSTITFTDDVRGFVLGEDSLILGDILGIGNEGSMDSLLGGAQWDDANSSLTMDAGNGFSLQALFDTDGVSLNIRGDSGEVVHTINVELTSDDYSFASLDETAAQEVLMEMIKDNL